MTRSRRRLVAARTASEQIQNSDPNSAVRSQKQVARLQVAMNDLATVNVHDGRTRLGHPSDRLSRRIALLSHAGEIAAGDQIHHHEPQSARRLTNAADGNDARVVERCHDRSFSSKAINGIRIIMERFAEELNRNVVIASADGRPINFSHASRTDQLLELILGIQNRRRQSGSRRDCGPRQRCSSKAIARMRSIARRMVRSDRPVSAVISCSVAPLSAVRRRAATKDRASEASTPIHRSAGPPLRATDRDSAKPPRAHRHAKMSLRRRSIAARHGGVWLAHKAYAVRIGASSFHSWSTPPTASRPSRTRTKKLRKAD